MSAADMFSISFLIVLMVVAFIIVFKPLCTVFILDAFADGISGIRTWVYRTKIAFFEPDAISTRNIHIDNGLINSPRKGYSFAGCPHQIIVKNLINNTISIHFSDWDEPNRWYYYPSVSFCTGRMSGRLKYVIVKYQDIRRRGQFFRLGCDATDWPKYFTSTVLAHLEALKFRQHRRSHHPTLVSRIFKHYGEQIFQDME